MYYFPALLVTLGLCGLRDYGTGEWTGGDTECPHQEPATGGNPKQGPNKESNNGNAAPYRDVCGRCGARRVDSQLGLEATPTLYVERMVAVFREVWRVLADSGTLWLNLGDSFLPNKQLAGIPWRVAFALQEAGWCLRSDLIWAKLCPTPCPNP